MTDRSDDGDNNDERERMGCVVNAVNMIHSHGIIIMGCD